MGDLTTEVLVVTPEHVPEGVSERAVVVVAGPDAEDVGRAVADLIARGAALRVAGFVGDPSDPALAEMIAELFRG